jgi:hypothetical protein
LPRKLREAVYEYVMTTDPPDHCWSAEYLGEECCSEVLNTYHRINVFKFKVRLPIKSTLRPETSVTAAEIREIGQIRVSFWYGARLAAYSTLGDKWFSYHDKYLDDAKASLQELVTFKAGARITINIEDIVIWAFYRVDEPDNPNFKTIVNTDENHIRKFLFNMSADFFPGVREAEGCGSSCQHRAT